MGFLETLSGFFKKRSIENPSTPLSAPDDWLLDLAGGSTSSGVNVNPQTAMTYAPVYRAVNLISQDVAKLPLVVYRRNGEGKDKATQHPAYRVLRYQTSSTMSAFEFKSTLTADALLYGSGYAAIIRNQAGTAQELIPLTPGATRENWNGDVRSYITTINNVEETLRAEDVLHIRALYGLGVVELARESIGLGMAAELYGSVFFKNNARPSAVLEHPGHLDNDARDNLRRSWQAMHGSVSNSHKVAILEEGMQLKAFASSNKDAEFNETRQLEVRNIASWFGIPPHMLADNTRTSYNSLESENQAYLDSSLDPWLCTWETECRAKLLTQSQQQRDTHFVEFNRNALVRANMEARGSYYNLAIQGGWMSRDEIRGRENLNPIPGEGGSTFMVPLNMGPAAAAAEDDQGGEELAARESGEVLLHDTLQRMAKRVCTGAHRAAKKGRFNNWLNQGMVDESRAVVLDALTPVLDLLEIKGDRSSQMLEFFYTLKDEYIGLIRQGGTAEQLPGIMAENIETITAGVSEELARRWIEGIKNGS